MLNHGIESYEAELDAEAEVERILAELRDALQRIRSLGSMITVCGSCKDIREPGGEWHTLEHFLQERLGVRFSHGLCPDCGRRLLDQIEGSGPGQPGSQIPSLAAGGSRAGPSPTGGAGSRRPVGRKPRSAPERRRRKRNEFE